MSDSESKVLPRERLISIVEGLRRSGRTIGVTNGTFDLIHAGHVKYLEDAKRYCDVLVVSVNTDSSVRRYKGEGRPIVSQDDRATVVAGLTSVDYVTFHDEETISATLLALKPDCYIKGGDYSRSQMTSGSMVEEWGGEVIVGQLIEGHSSTQIINKIAALYQHPIALPLDTSIVRSRRAVILDRDGVINANVEYLHEPDEFQFLPYALDGLKRFQTLGYHIVIATVQAGIGLGYFSEEDFFRVNRRMLAGFSAHGIIVSKIYFCPHGVGDMCECRKPKTGMIKRAAEDLNLDLGESWMLGDKPTDVQAGNSAGCHTILIGMASDDASRREGADYTVADLREAATVVERAARAGETD
jgi:rfaE bifunctional protein nucleotidyltransferase chain/domain